MTLACKHVDDIVIGAPYILTKDLISSLNISTVVHVTDTDEDVVKEEFNDIDPFTVAKEMGIFKEIEIKDPFYNITTESIAQRVYNNQAAFMKKFQNKAAKEK
jgi:ethanolamine-phosphate cytidylyltransferase